MVTGFIAIEHLPALPVTDFLAECNPRMRAEVYPCAHACNGEFVGRCLDNDAMSVLLAFNTVGIKCIVTQRKRIHSVRGIFFIDSYKASHGMSFRY